MGQSLAFFRGSPQIAARLKPVFVLICGFAAAFLALSSSAHAQQKRLYIANDDHTDYMWTADADVPPARMEQNAARLKRHVETKSIAPSNRRAIPARGTWYGR